MTSNNRDRFHLLIVDDDLTTRMMLRQMLKQIGFNYVVEAADAEAGYQEIILRRPHLVLCDIHMPPVDGFDLVRRVREFRLASVRETPILMLTADRFEDTVKYAKDLVVQGYIAKPTTMEILRDRIDAVLGA